MNENLEFEIEVPSVKIAKERVAEVKAAFGKDVYIVVKIVGDDKSKVLSTLNDGMQKTFSQIAAKLAKHKEEL